MNLLSLSRSVHPFRLRIYKHQHYDYTQRKIEVLSFKITSSPGKLLIQLIVRSQLWYHLLNIYRFYYLLFTCRRTVTDTERHRHGPLIERHKSPSIVAAIWRRCLQTRNTWISPYAVFICHQAHSGKLMRFDNQHLVIIKVTAERIQPEPPNCPTLAGFNTIQQPKPVNRHTIRCDSGLPHRWWNNRLHLLRGLHFNTRPGPFHTTYAWSETLYIYLYQSITTLWLPSSSAYGIRFHEKSALMDMVDWLQSPSPLNDAQPEEISGKETYACILKYHNPINSRYNGTGTEFWYVIFRFSMRFKRLHHRTPNTVFWRDSQHHNAHRKRERYNLISPGIHTRQTITAKFGRNHENTVFHLNRDGGKWW